MPKGPPKTPDGRYIVVKGILWRATNPNLSEAERTAATKSLMDARRDVKKFLHQDLLALKDARARVQQAKVRLGERGEPWWTDGTPCLNRRHVDGTIYKKWYKEMATTIEKEEKL